MIAGHARSRRLILITGNLAEFNRVEGLRSEDWLTKKRCHRKERSDAAIQGSLDRFPPPSLAVAVTAFS
jgi:tRNA(fMet)-specific endonuclease VapC